MRRQLAQILSCYIIKSHSNKSLIRSIKIMRHSSAPPPSHSFLALVSCHTSPALCILCIPSHIDVCQLGSALYSRALCCCLDTVGRADRSGACSANMCHHFYNKLFYIVRHTVSVSDRCGEDFMCSMESKCIISKGRAPD